MRKIYGSIWFQNDEYKKKIKLGTELERSYKKSQYQNDL